MATRKTKRHIPYMGKDGACLLHARLKDTQLDSPSNTRHCQIYPTIPNFWYSGSFSKVIVQALTIDHPLTRVFVLMCMLHPDKPSNLSGPWLTHVANMITGIDAAITRIYAACTWIYAAIYSSKFCKFHATRMKLKNIIPNVVLNAHHSLSGSSEARKQIMKH